MNAKINVIWAITYAGGWWRFKPPMTRPTNILHVIQHVCVSKKNTEHKANLSLPRDVKKLMAFSLAFSFRGRSPLIPRPGAVPLDRTPLGAPPPDPRYRLALCPLAMEPPFHKS